MLEGCYLYKVESREREREMKVESNEYNICAGGGIQLQDRIQKGKNINAELKKGPSHHI